MLDSSDFVTAFVDGGYEMGPRTAASCVPEPGAGLLLAIGIAGLLIVRLQEEPRVHPNSYQVRLVR